jgi:hypothetical protein
MTTTLGSYIPSVVDEAPHLILSSTAVFGIRDSNVESPNIMLVI